LAPSTIVPLLAAELFIAANAFVIVEEVPATIEYELVFVNLDCLTMMGRMAVNQIHGATIEEAVSESALPARDSVAPVPSPV